MFRLFRASPKTYDLRRDIEGHLGGNFVEAQALAHSLKPIERVNIQLVLSRWLKNTPGGRLIGYAGSGYSSDVLVQHLIDNNLRQAPVEWEQLASTPTEFVDCIKRGLYFLCHDGQPLVIGIRPKSDFAMGEAPILEIIALRQAVAHESLRSLLTEAERDNVYKGKVISLERPQSWREEVAIRFHDLRPAPREAIILPEAVLRVIERNVLGLLRHSETLRKSGRGTRHGLLLHGPPGTGKTLVIRHLAHVCQGHTVILLTGRQLGLIRESCQIARLLAPSLIVLEDVDLIAQDRRDNSCPMILHELLDEMDGLGPQSDCVFLLTSNRPEILEPALAARPGRIDQAVAFPLPDAVCRQRLFEVYGAGLNLAAVQIPHWVERTDGVSPAFIEELLRRAALLSAERGETTQPLPVCQEDMHQALHELVFFGGELTQKLLGYRPGKIGYQPPVPNVGTA